jgi:hypothetical protein
MAAGHYAAAHVGVLILEARGTLSMPGVADRIRDHVYLIPDNSRL